MGENDIIKFNDNMIYKWEYKIVRRIKAKSIFSKYGVG